MHTSLPILLIRSGKNIETFVSFVKIAYLLSLIGATGAVLLTIFFLNLDIASRFATAPIATAAACNAAAVVLSLSERVFQAADRIGEFNVLNMIGTLISLGTTFLLARNHGTAVGFVVAYYVGMLFPVLAATALIVPRLGHTQLPSLHEIRSFGSQLIGTGFFGLGYEISSYCKLQAPLALLGILGLSKEIAPIGLGLRFVGLLSGGLTIVLPILFLRIGTAIRARDERAMRLWTHLGIAIAVAIVIGTITLYGLFGKGIYRIWTGGAVTLETTDQIALAAFSALYLLQNILFSLAAPDPTVVRQLRWLFWLEGPAIVAAGAAGALAVPAAYGGAAILAGAASAMSVVACLLLCLIGRVGKHQNGAGYI
jgi:O-antigen/teichoic acid export membrane protein